MPQKLRRVPQPDRPMASALGFLLFGGVLFIQDVGEFGGVKDLPAELTLHEFGVFLSGDDTDLGMFARGRHMRKVD